MVVDDDGVDVETFDLLKYRQFFEWPLQSMDLLIVTTPCPSAAKLNKAQNLEADLIQREASLQANLADFEAQRLSFHQSKWELQVISFIRILLVRILQEEAIFIGSNLSPV